MKPDPGTCVAGLAKCCAEEMARYRRRQDHDPAYCYELFRRALVQRDQEAWAAVYSQYQCLVRGWLGDAPDDPDALVNRTFERFWRALPPDRFGEFPTLAHILGYLKCCAQGVAIDARRQEERARVRDAALARLREVVTGEAWVSSVERVLDAIVAQQLYERAMSLLNSSQERLVFRASIEWHLKPSAIAAKWPDVCASAREVSRVKERILRRLRRDRELRALLVMNGTDCGDDGRQSLCTTERFDKVEAS